MLILLWDQGTSEVELYRSYLHKHSYSDFTFWPREMDPNEEVSLEEVCNIYLDHALQGTLQLLI